MKLGKAFVVSIVALLASLSCQADQKSDIAASIQQLRQLSKHAADFTAAHENRLPKTFEELLGERKTDKTLLVSPLTADKTKPSYELLKPAEKVTQVADPSKTVLIRSVFKTNDGKKIAAFVDGHVSFVVE